MCYQHAMSISHMALMVAMEHMITNNLIKYQSFVYTQLNDQTVLLQIIQFSISHLFAHSLNVKQFFLILWLDPIRRYHTESDWTREWWQWMGTLHFPKLQHYWSLIIRLFNVIFRTLVGGVLALCRNPVGIFYCSSQLGFSWLEHQHHLLYFYKYFL